ncbi:hypothetical protein AB7942_23855 [Neobacillus sp. BF23-41]|uniref:hypothetical protein n=1 Tax=Neobacillus sp. BF23-41 TaxID=3240280 RepID=UPI0034E38BE6
MIKFEFKNKEESNFDQVYRFLCDQVHAFKRAMKQAKSLEERNILQEQYDIYNRLPYYEYLVGCMYGDYGQKAQLEAYVAGEKVMNAWNSRTNS